MTKTRAMVMTECWNPHFQISHPRVSSKSDAKSISGARWPLSCQAAGGASSPSAESAVGTEPTITIEAKASLTSLACRKAKDLGYPHEFGRRGFSPARPQAWTSAGAWLSRQPGPGKVCKILDQ